VENTVAEILNGFDGVSNTVTATQLSFFEFAEGGRNLIQHGYNSKRCGDVMIMAEPGVIEYKPTGTTHGSGYSYDTHVPLLWYGWKIPQGSTSDKITVTDIAATLASLLHIEFPNGCTGHPIRDLVK